MKIETHHINFAVGPVPIEEEIAAVGGEVIPYFRTAAFSALMKENEALILEAMHAPEGARALFLTGSGTAAMEAALVNLFDENDRLLIVKGGSFGQRFCEIASVWGIPFEAIALDCGEALTRAHLLPYEGRGFTGFLVNMGETSSGVLYDMPMIADFCRREGLSLVVDAISTFLADEVEMEAWGADAVLTGSQKALATAPGISIVTLSAFGVSRVMAKKTRCYYLDLKAALSNAERGQTPFTPAVGTLIQINRRLNKLKDEGFGASIARTRALADYFRERITAYPFEIATDSMQNGVTPLRMRSSLSAHRLFEILMEEYGIVVCPNGGALRDTMFRVGHIGYHTKDEYDKLFSAFDDLIARGIL
jgi:aspartate aminotransferase-like enzyme